MSNDAPPHAGDTLQAMLAEDYRPRAWLALFRELYFQIDRRTLGFSRILLGFYLLMDVFHRGRSWSDMYSSVGVLPTPLNLWKPSTWGVFTIFNAFDSPGELHVLWVVMAVNAFCLLIGYRTKLTQMVAFVLHCGMNSRVLFVENGGYVVNNLLLMWTMFLPLGDRFSLDALLASLRRRRETTAAELNDRTGVLARGMDRPHTSLVAFVITIQIAAIYYFNVIHKTGPAWRDGTAVHYVLYVDRMATPLISLVRDHVPNFLIIFMTRSAMAFEAGIPVLLLQPLARSLARRGVIFMMCTLHLAFGVTFVLGPFAWSCCLFATLLFSRDDWEIAARTMRRARRARTVIFDPRSGAAIALCRVLKRLDRFELLSFVSSRGPSGLVRPDRVPTRRPLPLGIGLSNGAKGHALLADVVAALPLGPCVAWVLRLPLVRDIVDAALSFLAARDVSAFLGLSPEAKPAPPPEPEAETPPVPAHVVIASLLLVAGAVGFAVWRDEALSGVILVLATVGATTAAATWFVLPVVTLRVLRRSVFAGLREFIVLAMFAGAVNQGLVEMWVFNRRFKAPQPEALRLLSHKMRFLQGWFMFSPNPVTDDNTIVVDAVTADGRHVDPFTNKPPYWELTKSLGLSQLWCDYFSRMMLPGNAQYRDAMRDYLLELPKRTGRESDEIVSGDVYVVKKMNPPWNSITPYGYDRSKLFSFENPARKHN